MTKAMKKAVMGAAVLLIAGLCGRRAWAVSSGSAQLDIDVQITGSLSVAVDGLSASTDTSLPALALSSAAVLASSHTVTNTSGGLNETWELSTKDVNPNGGTAWGVSASTGNEPLSASQTCQSGLSPCPGSNSYALQAVFVASTTLAGTGAGAAGAGQCPLATASDWDVAASTPVTGSPAIFGTGATSQFFTDARNDGATWFAKPDTTTGANQDTMLPYHANTNGAGQRGLCVRLIAPASVSDTNVHVIQLLVTAISPV